MNNIHFRTFYAAPERVGALLDALASADDRMWPRDCWPAMQLDRPLQVGAVGGHGPIRYVVGAYQPGRSVRFDFTAPHGFIGHHAFEVSTAADLGSRLTHTVELRLMGSARLSWPFVYRWLHDALIEDAFDRAALALDELPQRKAWNPWVRVLRNRLRRRAPAT